MKSYKLEPNSLRIIEKKYQTDFVILNDKFQDNSIDQTPLEPEQMIFSLNPSPDEKI